MNFRQMLARHVTGSLPTEDLPELALVGLEEGLDTPSLRILAGLKESESPFVIERYFVRVLDELHIELPSKRRAALEYAAAIADEVLSNQRNLVTGVGELFRAAIDTYPFPSKRSVYDGVGLSEVYVLLLAVEDLYGADARWWANEKSLEQVLSETEAQLRSALRAWREELARRRGDF